MNGSDWSTSPRYFYENTGQFYRPNSSTIAENRMPMTNEPRVIPIRRIDSGHDYYRGISSSSSQFYDNEPESWKELCYDRRRKPELFSTYDEYFMDHIREKELQKERETRHRNRLQHSAPARSQSSHAVAVYDRTFRVDDPASTGGVMVGDRCAWISDGVAHKGTIKFIGHLKGHSNLYAGIDFDEKVGKGTGVFQGEVLFQTPENHAGFVLLSALEILPRYPAISDNSNTKHISAVQKQTSAESLRDIPCPPPVPPRPTMRAEDYMIDSFSVGSCVEVCHLGACRSGVIRWIGDALSQDYDHIERSAVVELDDVCPSGWRPAHNAPMSSAADIVNGVLVPTTALRRDRRIVDQSSSNDSCGSPVEVRTDFGSVDSGVESSKCDPCLITDDLIGRMKGIQGHRNSCYLDATLYAMFVQSTAFDRLLDRPATKDDIPQYREFQRLLATEVVYPLRKFHYVRADHIMKVRELLSKALPNMRGLTNEEKDPEEVLIALLGSLLKAPPLVELINLKDNKVDRTYLCPLIVDDWTAGVATTQHLLDRSFRSANVKFAYPPKTLILQLPRYGQQKLFDKILPLEHIEITGLVNNATQACYGCGKPAEGMCPECFLCKRVTLSEVSYCVPCSTRIHFNAGEQDHAMRLFYPSGQPVRKPHVHRMVLSAVLCIETSHYVAFVRALSGRWLFFDSMADREGLSDGFNVPQVKDCERMSWWLSQAGWERLRDADESGTMKAMMGKGSDVDPLVTRLLSDSYICFYNEEPSNSTSSSSSSSSLLNNMIQKVVKPLT
ncbi:CAP-Gly domain [Parelaphostrongylus tenuis]|uniref:ubiquitinyl hydrolase 1 n=1 Tax=Parelaphostrongylus tenuis TaxID=148309 RepID=A0AAD5MSE8_PARTN|nr:CAP-Gly domain [Parelaphostrongylus tenuis]